MRGRIKLERITALEDTLTDLLEQVRSASMVIGKVEVQFFERGAGLSREEVDLFTAKRSMDTVLHGIPTVADLLVLAPVMAALKAAHAMVQADMACMRGRDDCEKQWDGAMATLKRALNRFDFTDADTGRDENTNKQEGEE